MVTHRDVQGELPDDMTSLLDLEGTEARLRRTEGIPRVETRRVRDVSTGRADRRARAQQRLAARRLV